MTTSSPNRTRWSREQIHAARLAPLVPLLQQRCLRRRQRALKVGDGFAFIREEVRIHPSRGKTLL